MLLSGCVLCAIRSPGTPVRDLMRSMQTKARVLCSLSRCRAEQLSVHPTYHAQQLSGFLCENSRNFSFVTQCRWKKYSAVYRQCVLSDIYTNRDTKSRNCLSFRSVSELGCRQRSDVLLNSDTGFQHSFINVGDQARIQLRFYSTKEPKTFSETDSKKKIDADKQTITDLVNVSILRCKILF